MKPLPFFKGVHPGTNVLLEIGGQVCFIAPDAASAAKVADLLATFQPVRAAWDYVEGGSSLHVLIHERTAYSHRVQISSVAERRQFADDAEYQEWKAGQVKAQDVKAEDGKEVES